MEKMAAFGMFRLAFLAIFCQSVPMEISSEALGMARIGLGIERDELAEILGVSVRTVANWERNGVPQHRVVLVMSKIGTHIRSAQGAIESAEWFNSPEGIAASEQRHREHEEALSANGGIETGPSNRLLLDAQDANAMEEFFALRDLLTPYSTAGLLREVMRRVGEVGIDQLLQAKGAAGDPENSEVPAQINDGSAGREGGGNEGHQELPHEP